MNSFNYGKITGYLQCCSDILSMNSAPCCTTFTFNNIGDSSDMLLTFKNYFIALWNEYGIPNCYQSFSQLVDEFDLHFIKIDNWKESITESLDYWICPLFETRKTLNDLSFYKVKFIIDNVIAILDDFFKGTSFQVFTFAKEDEEFIKNNLDYLKNEDYIFKTDKEIFWFHLGLSN